MKCLYWNENKTNINLFITQFVIRFFLYLPGSSQTDDLGKYKNVLNELIEQSTNYKNPKLLSKENGAIREPANEVWPSKLTSMPFYSTEKSGWVGTNFLL